MAPEPANIYSQTHGQGKAGAKNIVRCCRLRIDQHIVDEWRISYQIY